MAGTLEPFSSGFCYFSIWLVLKQARSRFWFLFEACISMYVNVKR